MTELKSYGAAYGGGNYEAVPAKGLRPKVARKYVLFILTFSLLFPILPIGNRFELCEPLIYLAALLLIIRSGKVALSRLSFSVSIFLLLFFAIQILSVSLAVLYGRPDVAYGADDLYQLRQFLQLSCSVFVFSILIDAVSKDDYQFKRLIYLSSLIALLPSLISIMQGLDVLGAKLIVTDLYKTVFLQETMEQRLSYRVASVFSDSYTAGIYVAWASLFVFHVLINIRLKRVQFLILSLYICVAYVSEFYTLRTGILIIPIGFLLIGLCAALFSPKANRRAAMTSLIVFGTSAVVVAIIIFSNADNFSWALQAFNLFSGVTRSDLPSFYVTNVGNLHSWAVLSSDLSQLVFPVQIDISRTYRDLFLDSFYFSGIFQYGIWVILLYLCGMLALLFYGVHRRNYYFVAIAILSLVISWKGSNGILMTRADVILGFFLVASDRIVFRRKRDKGGAPLYSQKSSYRTHRL